MQETSFKCTWVVVSLVILILGNGCAGSETGVDLQHAARAAGGFLVHAIASDTDPGVQGEAGYRIEVVEDGTGLSVQVRADGCRGIKSTYFDLEYDQSSFTPIKASPAGCFAGQDGLLALALLDDPGTVHYGQVLANWDRRGGFDGDLLLAEVRFEKAQAGRGSRQLSKQTSTPPTSSASRTFINYSGLFGEYSWPYANQGDYNQDGVVSINDLTPLGLFFGETGPFYTYSRQEMVDGNGDGEISISDITPIGANFDNSAIGGYNMYQSASLTDYPAGNDTADSVPPVGNIPLSNTVVDRTVGRMEFREAVADPPGTDPFYFWVRPVDDEGTPGTPSLAYYREIGPPSELVLNTPASGGTGTEIDPYVLDPSVEYLFSIVHPVRGDITFEPGTFISMTWTGTISVGTVNQSTATLVLNPEYTGTFRMHADVNGVVTDPELYLRVPDPTNVPPTASFLRNPIAGIAPHTMDFDASSSSDSDGTIVSYEWDFDGDGTFGPPTSSPTISYKFVDGGQFDVGLRVTDDDGATDTETEPVWLEGWEKFLVDGRDDVGKYPFLAVIDGKPAISYVDSGGSVNYVRALTESGSEWGAPVELPPSAVASQVMLKEVDGRPGIVYKRSGPAEPGIKYALGSNADGDSWESVSISSGAEDHSPTLQLVGGHPAIAYVWDNGAPPDNFTLLYIRSADTTGMGSGAWDSFPSVLRSAEQFRMDNQSLFNVQFRPAIIYMYKQNVPGFQWKTEIVIANDAGATSWAAPAQIGYLGENSGMDYLAVDTVNVRPNMAYRVEDTGEAWFQRTDDIAAVVWESSYQFPHAAAGQNRGYFLELDGIAGLPAICHYDKDSGILRYSTNTSPPYSEFWTSSEIADVGSWDTNITHQAYVSLEKMAFKPMVAYYSAIERNLVFATYFEIP